MVQKQKCVCLCFHSSVRMRWRGKAGSTPRCSAGSSTWSRGRRTASGGAGGGAAWSRWRRPGRPPSLPWSVLWWGGVEGNEMKWEQSFILKACAKGPCSLSVWMWPSSSSHRAASRTKATTSRWQPRLESTDRPFPVSLTVRHLLPHPSTFSLYTFYINIMMMMMCVCRWHPLSPALLPVPSQRPAGHGQRQLLR